MDKKSLSVLTFIFFGVLSVPSALAVPGSSGHFENYFNGGGSNDGSAGYTAVADNYHSLLQGGWMGSNGKDVMKLVFMGDMVGLELNNQQAFGNFFVNGNQLQMKFTNGKSLSYSFTLNNNVLILDNSVRLERQNMQNVPSGGNTAPTTQPSVPQSSGGAPTGGTWGGPATSSGGQQNGWVGGDSSGQPSESYVPTQPAPPTGPQVAKDGGILNGTWSCQTPQGVIAFTFQGQSYACFVNNQQTETGVFQYDPSSGNFNYQITSGASTGVSGQNRIFVQGNIMTLIMPNGMQMVFQKQL
ncbi:MAG: hypothetical protein J6M93_06180 [Succinivibrio sp.]|nr:hypothetical protein [Succinivibrio sp.]